MCVWEGEHTNSCVWGPSCGLASARVSQFDFLQNRNFKTILSFAVSLSYFSDFLSRFPSSPVSLLVFFWDRKHIVVNIFPIEYVKRRARWAEKGMKFDVLGRSCKIDEGEDAKQGMALIIDRSTWEPLVVKLSNLFFAARYISLCQTDDVQHSKSHFSNFIIRTFTYSFTGDAI